MVIIEKYKKHSIINKIKKIFFQNRFSFEFQPIDRKSALKEIRSLNASKACQESDTLTKVVKEMDELFADFIYSAFNEYIIQSNIFPSCVTKAEVTSIFTKKTQE